MEFNYAGGTDPHYSVDRMGTTTGQMLFNCEHSHGRMVLNESAYYKVISSSIIMGALADGAALNIKPYLIAEIVNYFMRFDATPVLPGDSNCDGLVNVLDVIANINYILVMNPDPFCFENADVNGDNTINVIDVIAIINIVLGNKSAAIPGLISEMAHISLNPDGIELESDGTLAGIQFEITGAGPDQFMPALPSHEFVSNVIDGKMVGIIFSHDNTPIPAGRIRLLNTHNTFELKWGEVIGANINAQYVTVKKHQDNLIIKPEELVVTAFPNPARGYINIHANDDIEIIRFFNQLGETVYENFVGSRRSLIYTMNISPGVYILEVRTANDLSFQKVMIK